MLKSLSIKISKKKRVLRYRLLKLIEDYKGLDTLKFVELEELGFSNIASVRYEASESKYLKRIINDLEISPDDSIIDLGSGKGSALICFSKFPFNKILGVELSKKLVEICENNLKVLKITNVKVINLDVYDFNQYDNFNYIYLFNPFHETVLRIVLENILTSIKKVKRSVFIVYKNPTCHELIMKCGQFILYKEYKFRNIAYPKLNYFYVYKSNL